VICPRCGTVLRTSPNAWCETHTVRLCRAAKSAPLHPVARRSEEVRGVVQYRSRMVCGLWYTQHANWTSVKGPCGQIAAPWPDLPSARHIRAGLPRRKAEVVASRLGRPASALQPRATGYKPDGRGIRRLGKSCIPAMVVKGLRTNAGLPEIPPLSAVLLNIEASPVKEQISRAGAAITHDWTPG